MVMHTWLDSIMMSIGLIGLCAGLVYLLAFMGTTVNNVVGYVKGRLLVRRLTAMVNHSRANRMATMGKREHIEEPQGEAIDAWVAEQFAEDEGTIKANLNKPMATECVP